MMVGGFMAFTTTWADDKSTLELRQTQMQLIEARQGQIQAQSQLLQITFSELEKQKAILADQIRLLEEKVKKEEPKKEPVKK